MDRLAQIGALLDGATQRIWEGDAECVYRSRQPYVRFLERLAALAKSGFAPQQLSETWVDHEGWTICVRATLNGHPITFWIPRRGDYLDLRLVSRINRLLLATGYQFAVIPGGQDLLIAWVTPGEQARIEQALDQPCLRVERKDEVAFFLATVPARLLCRDYEGLRADAATLLADGPDAGVYAARGRAAYEAGNRHAAWLDWAHAAQHGWGEIYRQVAAWYGRDALH